MRGITLICVVAITALAALPFLPTSTAQLCPLTPCTGDTVCVALGLSTIPPSPMECKPLGGQDAPCTPRNPLPTSVYALFPPCGSGLDCFAKGVPPTCQPSAP